MMRGMSKFTSLLAGALALASVFSIAFAQQNTISTLPISGLQFPHKAISDAAGNVYVSDTNNNCVKRLTPANVVEVFAGTCVGGYGGDGGAATSAQLNNPYGLVFDSTGNLYIADRVNRRVRKVATDGSISTFAGTGSSGYSGDGGAATLAQLADPVGLAIDSSDRLYIADLASQRVRRVENGIIRTFAGTGTPGGGGDGGLATAAQLHQPVDVAVDGSGVVYIADRLNASVRRVNLSGVIDTVIGPNNATLNNPDGIAVTASGIVFVPDRYGNRVLVRSPSGAVSVYAGTGAAGYSGDGGPATLAALQQPTGLFVDPAGNLLIGDTYNHSVRRVAAVGTFANGVCGSASGAFAASPPTTNLCASGIASAVVTGTGNYTWTCAGTDGGETKSCSAGISTRQLTVPAGAYPGIQFTNPLASSQVSCSINATGQWSNGQGSQTTDADGYGAICAQCPDTNSPSQRLVMQRGSSWEAIGRAKQILLAPNETVRFANNDSIGFYADNTGSMTLDIACSELTSNPSVTLTLPRVPILTESVVHGDGHIGGRMDDGVSLGQELRTGETLRIACSGTCIWSASVEPLSASSWLKLTTASNGVGQPSGLSQLAFSVNPFEETQNSRTGIIRVSVNGGASASWTVTQNPLTDWDEDGVADEWEQRGYPSQNGTREALSGSYVNTSQVWVVQSTAPYGRIVPGTAAPATAAEKLAAKSYRDIWLWIDEMSTLPDNVQLKASAIRTLQASFLRQNIIVRVRRAVHDFGNLPSTSPLLWYTENCSSASDRDAVSNSIETLKNHSLKRMSSSSAQLDAAWRKKIWRHVVWGRDFAIRDKSDTNSACTDLIDGSSGLAPGFGSFNLIYGAPGDVIQDRTAQAGTLMHELGHTLGLGHGGPLSIDGGKTWIVDTENPEAEVATGYTTQISGYFRHRNYKPTHLSVMNYAYQKGGVTTNDPNLVVDYDGIELLALNPLDEIRLGSFWNNPFGASYGATFACLKNNSINFQLRPKEIHKKFADSMRTFSPGQRFDCGDFLGLRQTPTVADLDMSGSRDEQVTKITEWDKLAFGTASSFLDFLGIRSASASSLSAFGVGLQEPDRRTLIFPTDFRVSITSLVRRVSLRNSGTYVVVFKVTNGGLKSDTYSFNVNAPSFVMMTSSLPNITMSPGESRYLTIDFAVDGSTTVGAIGELAVIAQSTTVATNSDEVNVDVQIVDNLDDVTPQIVTPAQETPVQDFSFPIVLNAVPDSYVESNSVTLLGMNVPRQIQVRGGEMSINGGGWTSYLAIASPGDSLRLRVVSSPFGGDTRSVEVAVGGLVRSFDVTTMATCGLDVNGDTNISSEVDGLLLTRYMLGFRDDALVSGMALTGLRTLPGAISNYIGSGAMRYEVFGRTSATPLATTDGLILTRLMLGFSDAALLSGIEIPNDAVFTTASEIRTHVNKKCGTNFVSQ